MEEQTIRRAISHLMKQPVITKITLIQTLWAGHGNIYRVNLTGAECNSIILKEIKFKSNLPHKYNKESLFAQKRKKESYKNELFWYKNLKEQNLNIKIPRYINSEQTEDGIILILEDLAHKGFFPIKDVSLDVINSAVFWLANLHAKYLNHPDSSFYPQGNYWHLSTRPDEFKALSDKDKNYGILIDKVLTSAKHQTLIHGDAKLANFLFNKESIAGVDYQYIGVGAGIIDLMYFLSSIFDENLECNELKYLNLYFKYLEASIKSYQPTFNSFSELKSEWLSLYEYAWADFYRFLLGWNPNHYKLDHFSFMKYQNICNKIK